MAPKKSGVEHETQELYGLDPAQFIGARDALAKRLKADGRADDAAEVKALRRPTVAAWAANQVARQRSSDVDELLAAGAELRQAQRKVLSGVKAGGLREAMDRRRRAVTTLVKAAEAFLEESGKGSAGTVDALSPTFEAASVDEAAGRLLKTGRLEKELAAPSGFGGVTGLEVVAAPVESPKPRGGKKAEKEEDRAAREAAEAARRQAREMERQGAEARRKAMRARATAARGEERVEQLTQQLAEAKGVVKQALNEAKEAEAEAKRAEAEAKRAEATAARALKQA